MKKLVLLPLAFILCIAASYSQGKGIQVKAPKQEFKWVICIVTNSTYSYAKREKDIFEKRLKEPCRIFEMDNGDKKLYRVTVGNYNTQEDATDVLPAYKAKYPACIVYPMGERCDNPTFDGTKYICE